MGILDAPSVAMTNAGQERIDTILASTLRPVAAQLADVANSRFNILAIGDSIVEGQGSTAVTYRWIDRLLALLRAQFQPAGVGQSAPYIPAWYAFNTPAGVGPVVGGVLNTDYQQETQHGLGRRSIVQLTATGTITFTFTGTSFDLLYTRRTDSSFTYSVDGGGAVTVASGTAAHTKVSVTGLAPGSHTVVVTRASGTPTIEGLKPYNADENAGIHLWDGAHFGLTSSSFASDFNWGQSIPDANPHLILLALGVNDYGTNVASATYKTNLLSIISQVRTKAATAPILLVADFQRGNVASPAEPWANYVQAMYDIQAADTTIAIVDLTKRMLSGDADTFSLYNADKVHPTNKGYQFMASTIGRFLLRSMPAAGTPAATPNELLTVTSYNPGSAATPSGTTAYSDVDATNVKVTFTAPTSGRVLVRINGILGGANGVWNLRDSGGDIANTDMVVTSSTGTFRWSSSIAMSGLTPGTSYTWKLGFKATSGTCTMKYGGGNGPVTMEVLAA